ncbi:MAG: hypothetical protein WA081_12795 [Desulfosalsimonadaceae bacterium]
MKYGKAFGGFDPELIEGEVFKIIVKYPDFEKRSTGPIGLRPESGVESGVESEMVSRILSILTTGPMAKAEIAGKLGKAGPTRYLNELMARLVEQVIVEYTVPGKPNSRLQKYRLTEKGRQLLKTFTSK